MPSEHLRSVYLLQPEPCSGLPLTVNTPTEESLPAAPCLLHGVKVSQSHPVPGLSVPREKLLLSVILAPC